ncbi:MAG: response regulator [Saprospiraceae bacterium]|nr:response regulator [Candidatus Opimibacter skivensis]
MDKLEVLIIDDEPQIRKLLSIVLESDGYKVWTAQTGLEGISVAASRKPDIILLDLGLPDKSGIEVLKELRQWYVQPILIISVQNREGDIIGALDLGADDYITKPFRTGELLARTRASQRRISKDKGKSILVSGPITIDLEARTVLCNGLNLKLTATEYHLLTLFVINEGKVLTHLYLLKEVWGDAYQSETQYLRVFVGQLRRKIEKNPNRPQHILTESGIGYRFVSETAL